MEPYNQEQAQTAIDHTTMGMLPSEFCGFSSEAPSTPAVMSTWEFELPAFARAMQVARKIGSRVLADRKLMIARNKTLRSQDKKIEIDEIDKVLKIWDPDTYGDKPKELKVEHTRIDWKELDATKKQEVEDAVSFC